MKQEFIYFLVSGTPSPALERFLLSTLAETVTLKTLLLLT